MIRRRDQLYDVNWTIIFARIDELGLSSRRLSARTGIPEDRLDAWRRAHRENLSPPADRWYVLALVRYLGIALDTAIPPQKHLFDTGYPRWSRKGDMHGGQETGESEADDHRKRRSQRPDDPQGE